MANIYLILNRRRQVCKQLRINDLSDTEIMQMTRFPRYAVSELCEMLKDDLSRNTARSRALPIDTQMLAALQFYASGSFQWMVGRSCGLSQSAVSHCVGDVTDALLKRSPEYISFPTDTPTLRSTTKQSLYTVAHFPNVIGAIDCTHIPIKAPSVNEEACVDRKGTHSVNVEAVCDADMRLLDVVAKWPGSSHDSFIWRSSDLRDVFSHGLVQGGWLLGKPVSFTLQRVSKFYLQSLWGKISYFQHRKYQNLWMNNS